VLTFIIIIGASPFLFGFVWLLKQYISFRTTDAYRWREQIFARSKQLHRQYDAANRIAPSSDIEGLRQQLFNEHLADVSVDCLSRFAGIGPVTIERLYNAGLRSLVDAQGYPFSQLQGIGPSKEADIRAAVRQVVDIESDRFDAGDCDHGREFVRRSEAMRQRDSEREATKRQELNELAARLEHLAPDLRIAKQITFMHCVLSRAESPAYEKKFRDRLSRQEDSVATVTPSFTPEEPDSPAPAKTDTVPLATPPSVIRISPSTVEISGECPSCHARLKVKSFKERASVQVACPRCNMVCTLESLPKHPSPAPLPQPAGMSRNSDKRVVQPERVEARRSKQPDSDQTQEVDLFLAGRAASSSQSAPEHRLLPALRTFAGFGLMVAKADGRIAKAERKAVRDLLESFFAHDQMLARFIDPVIEQVEQAIPDEDAATSALIRMCRPDDRPAIYRAAVRIADACGSQNRAEVSLLARLAVALGIESGAAEIRPKDVMPDSTSGITVSNTLCAPVDHRVILGIDPHMELSPELVRRRFNLQFEKLDPVKAAALGAEFAAMAHAKRTELRSAAEALMAPFGQALDLATATQSTTELRHNPELDDVFGA